MKLFSLVLVILLLAFDGAQQAYAAQSPVLLIQKPRSEFDINHQYKPLKPLGVSSCPLPQNNLLI
jgi:hypothetical protein